LKGRRLLKSFIETGTRARISQILFIQAILNNFGSALTARESGNYRQPTAM